MPRVNANEGFSRQLLSKLILTICPSLGLEPEALRAGLARLVETTRTALASLYPTDAPPAVAIAGIVDGMPGETVAALMVVCDEYLRTVLAEKT